MAVSAHLRYVISSAQGLVYNHYLKRYFRNHIVVLLDIKDNNNKIVMLNLLRVRCINQCLNSRI